MSRAGLLVAITCLYLQEIMKKNQKNLFPLSTEAVKIAMVIISKTIL